MKNLDLNVYSVQEMNLGELRTIEGGSPWSLLWRAIEWLGVADMAYEFGEGFGAGFEQGYNEK
ncbi:hypothetical protein AGMMS49525_00890 [Bacteroidia bacterium]|nr:hypothetical protein AGMMS49525_00890 [Bacteroidia bacterium]